MCAEIPADFPAFVAEADAPPARTIGAALHASDLPGASRCAETKTALRESAGTVAIALGSEAAAAAATALFACRRRWLDSNAVVLTQYVLDLLR